ncbi:hypothetical protein [Nocardioides sp. TF02-7]|uniref:hypothetical protein n=1 Tax=Nocardioides sp. TF02-7 TaxID=2917724 RepID=UPI001F05C816|nr:hypothetical protein [Nocardioides sp. TF02-7]UMG92580.1 hypothetical protein MF408_22725 [Nocardioides sp. TF02-7]
MSLPTADDLFRPTADPGTDRPDRSDRTVRAVPDAPETDRSGTKRPSGRIRHDEKMTVYVTSAELMEIEQVRLRLRGEHGLAVDRGRLVREALSLVLAEFEVNGEDSALVRRLRE